MNPIVVMPARRDRPALRSARRGRAAGAVIGLLGIASVALPALAATGADRAVRIAGLTPLDPALAAHWCVSGAWLYPVGDPLDLGSPGPDGAPGYTVNRGVEPPAAGRTRHEGADLCNRLAGGEVCAAAQGLVVRVAAQDSAGYGVHVVLAHRLTDGRFAYSVYAHLARGSIAVSEGEMVAAGQRLGRVGRTGRASTDHLHFEVRLADDPGARWERTPAADPIAFLAGRLPAHATDSTSARPYLLWADCAALIAPSARGGERLQRTTWWRMMARAAWDPLVTMPADPESLQTRLIGNGLLPEGRRARASGPVDWAELRRDLSRLRHVGLALPRRRVSPDTWRPLALERLGDAVPSPRLARPNTPEHSGPTIAEACFALADLGATLEPQADLPATGADPP